VEKEEHKLNADAYLEQFHNHHHYKEHSYGRRKWYEPIGTKPKEQILDKFKKK
jgi:hypothetical protein